MKINKSLQSWNNKKWTIIYGVGKSATGDKSLAENRLRKLLTNSETVSVDHIKDKADKMAGNLILIGGYHVNEIVQQINHHLPIQYIDKQKMNLWEVHFARLLAMKFTKVTIVKVVVILQFRPFLTLMTKERKS